MPMPSLPEPIAAPPMLFGEIASSALLPWAWALERLIAAHDYWVVAVLPDGRPISRPLWAVWLHDGLWFTTGSRMIRGLRTNPQVSVNLEDGREVVILEGRAEPVGTLADLNRFVLAYNAKYEHSARIDADGTVADADGPIGPAYRVRPRVVFGWQTGMRDPTRWTFADAQSGPTVGPV